LEIRVLHDRVVRILVSEDNDLRLQMARTVTEFGSLLLTCEREEASLEELFMSLVKESS